MQQQGRPSQLTPNLIRNQTLQTSSKQQTSIKQFQQIKNQTNQPKPEHKQISVNSSQVQQQKQRSYGIQKMIQKIQNNIMNDVNGLLENIGGSKLDQNQEQKINQQYVTQAQNEQKQNKQQTQEKPQQQRKQQQQQDQITKQQRLQKQQKLQKIRKKQLELIQQLNLLRMQERQLLNNSNDYNKYNSMQQDQQYSTDPNLQSPNRNQQPQEQQQQQQQQILYQFKPKITQSSLSPLKTRRRYPKPKPKPKLVIPPPIIPQISRNQFEMKVKQIAGHIRSKVHKYNPLINSARTNGKNKDKEKDNKTGAMYSNSLGKRSLYQNKQKMKVDLFDFKLPEIQPKNKNNRIILNNMSFGAETTPANKQIQQNINKIVQQNNSNIIQQNNSKLLQQNSLEPSAQQPKTAQQQQKQQQQQQESAKTYKNMKSIVLQIIKQAFNKISYKEKYGIKLDPTHHKYPMTSFRKKIIQEKSRKQKDRSMSQSLKLSMLNYRKQVLQKSRYK